MRDVDIDPVTQLVRALTKIPGVGPKSAQRIAMHVLRSPEGLAEEIAESFRRLAKFTRFCSKCKNISSDELCPICSDHKRDASIVCVVEEPADVTAIEKTGVFKGLYHVLHGALSPMDGVGPDDIKLSSLLDRVKSDKVREIIIATNPDAEGEATAHLIARRLKSAEIEITRIARGVPVGGDLQYVDEATLGEAISGRSGYK